MTLSDKDGQLFYQLWLPLLDYVNKKYKVNKKLKNIAGAERLDPAEVKQVANVLWDNVSIIDEYLKKHGEDILEEHKQIILGWKHRIQGRFVMERHLKKGSIFISLEDANVYLVRGIISGWEEMFPAFPLPLVVEATFIPFRDVIISDGIVAPYMISIGKNMAVDFKNVYMDAKKNNRLIQSLLTNEFTMNHVMAGDKNMIYKMRKKFDKLVEKCYGNMIGAGSSDKCWEQAFELLREIVLEERKTNPHYARQMDAISDDMDSDYDILGWLEDCLDEMDMKGRYHVLLHMCDELLKLFNWSEYIRSDIKFRRASVLEALGREKEAVDYCTKWIRKEPNNIMAATASVYAFIAIQKYEQAEELVELFIPNKTMCTTENSIMFTAASKLYEAMGRIKEKKQIDKSLEAYDEYLEEYFENLDCDDWDDEDDEFWDAMPFC